MDITIKNKFIAVCKVAKIIKILDEQFGDYIEFWWADGGCNKADVKMQKRDEYNFVSKEILNIMRGVKNE